MRSMWTDGTPTTPGLTAGWQAARSPHVVYYTILLVVIPDHHALVQYYIWVKTEHGHAFINYSSIIFTYCAWQSTPDFRLSCASNFPNPSGCLLAWLAISCSGAGRLGTCNSRAQKWLKAVTSNFSLLCTDSICHS